VVKDVRQDLNIADLPFIVGNLAERYGVEMDPKLGPETVKKVNTIKGILKALPDKVKHTGFVDSNGLNYADAPRKCTHFDKASYVTLGKRYCVLLEKMASGGEGRLTEKENPLHDAPPLTVAPEGSKKKRKRKQ